MQPAVSNNYNQDFPSLEVQPSQGEYKGYEFYTQYPVENQKKTEELIEKRKLRNEVLEQISQEFSDLEQTRGKTLYKDLTGKLCDVYVWKRVLREVRDVNNDFHSLRACIGVVADMIGVLHFLLYPSHGAMADKPLCGRILIPKDYPKMPPVVHLSTQVNRANFNVYHSYHKSDSLIYMHSSMCFDIVNPKDHGGNWEPEFTLSALIASLLQAIVSVKVAQIGTDFELVEFVSMEKLSSIYDNVEKVYRCVRSFMPSRKQITHIEPMEVKTKHFEFPDKITSLTTKQDLITISNPIFLQVSPYKMKDNVYSIGFDLSDLQSNIYTVFSIILSNSPYDPVGKKYKTILVRNGVTATAAKKRVGGRTEWFYHGKPMNESDLRIIVTVGYNQFCISYYVDGDRKVIHGDCPVSFLTPAEIGNVNKRPFYLSILLKNKRGAPVTVKTFIPEYGCVHPVAADIH